MGQYIRNMPIKCRSCGHGPFAGRESSYAKNKTVFTECRWICPRCGSLTRLDTKETPILEKSEK